LWACASCRGLAPQHPARQRLGQPVIGGAVVGGEKDKDPEVLAHRIFALHTERDSFRDQVFED
jgi:hypothetical protein